MDAVNSGRADLVKLLLEKGGRFNPASAWGRAALKVAQENHPRILNLLRAHQAE
ncbi:MAG: hypothetical protein AB1646_26170 [Thermodesulfobacteriota bacterium]